MPHHAAPQPPKALLFITRLCPHCPTVLQGLSELVKTGTISELEVINLDQAPARAQELGIRSVPWLRLGPFVLQGLYSPAELARWAAGATSPQGYAAYLGERIAAGQLAQAMTFLRQDPAYLAGLTELLGDTAMELSTRIGTGALLEDLAGSELMAEIIPGLIELTQAPDPRLRGDAAHYLGLQPDPRSTPVLQALLQDPDADVREIAADSLATLADGEV